MRPAAHLLLVVLVAASVLPGGHSSAITGLQQQQLQAWLQWLPASARSLLQQQQTQQQQRASPAATTSSNGVPMCVWNDVKEVCTPTQLVYLSLSAQPTTLVHRAAATAYDRNLVCNGHPDAASCHQDRANRCMYWHKSCVGMDAFEAVNWLNAVVPLDGDAALLDFTCPGTVAAQLKACRTATEAGAKGICNSLPGCQFVAQLKACLPKDLESKPQAEVESLIKTYNALDASLWGSCEGACYVRQAAACQKSYNSSSDCKAKSSYCVWHFDAFEGRKVCAHLHSASRATDAFSQEYAAVKESCAKLKGQAACEEPRVRPKQAGKFRRAAAAKQQRASVVTESGGTCVI